MLRAFMILLSLIDREVIADVAHRALALGLTTASILGCIGASFAVRCWFSKRSQTGSPIRRAA